MSVELGAVEGSMGKLGDGSVREVHVSTEPVDVCQSVDRVGESVDRMGEGEVRVVQLSNELVAVGRSME